MNPNFDCAPIPPFEFGECEPENNRNRIKSIKVAVPDSNFINEKDWLTGFLIWHSYYR